MSREDQASTFNTDALFDKFKNYFDDKFNRISSTQKSEEDGLKELKNKLVAKDLHRPGNSAQYEFCGQLEIYLDKIKLSILKTGDTEKTIEAIQQAEDLIKDRKQKIKIADESKAGWTTVQFLEKGSANNLTSEQRKRVQTAEDAALKELEARKRPRISKQHDRDYTYTQPIPNSADRSLFRGKCIHETHPNRYFFVLVQFSHIVPALSHALNKI